MGVPLPMEVPMICVHDGSHRDVRDVQSQNTHPPRVDTDGRYTEVSATHLLSRYAGLPYVYP